MKRSIIVFLLSCCLLLGFISISWAAIHSYSDDLHAWNYSPSPYWQEKWFRLSNDTWYTVESPKPNFHFNFMNSSTTGTEELEYYRDEFDFFGVNYLDGPDYRNLRGSFKTNFGLFVGADFYLNRGDSGNVFVVSPGYCLNLGNRSYLALSADYYNDKNKNDLHGYDIDFKYYLDNAKIFAQYYSPTSNNFVYTKNLYEAGANFKLSENIVIGGSTLNIEGNSIHSAGLTWTPGFMVLDFRANNDNTSLYINERLTKSALSYYGTSYEVSSMFNFGGHFAAGVNYLSYEQLNDPRITLKLKFYGESFKFSVAETIENNSWGNVLLMEMKKTF